ncbi:diacylglycerol kinase [Salinicoccus roseus]|jgi:diacylglycerol kinase (ATP)|uniref:Diacylglycerol kinase n=1 Tax=Salinicoccus roseus TaxID=45670 RepID=A0A265E598_9STAP|nr:diacylglycerol kinase [Salinicoccus roseus]OZT76626.1 diacylglycerol kinase [Salinicoccus roseus]RPE51712.1 diacylglycerol kinase (ATP) [Salinicoccus roseus]GGA76735.1 diacylglycerol kinase [Salinicoccus roseus]
MKTARIIYNPTSGREAFKESLAEVLERLEVGGYITSTHATTCAGDATQAAAKACDLGFDLIVAAGGDGTVNEVVNGMAAYDERPALGIIPMGTVNDFAKALHIPPTIDEAVEMIVSGQSARIDIGRMNSKYFINIAGGGKITEVSYEAPSKLKSIIGPLAYYVKGIEMLPKIRSTNVKIEYDDNVFEGKVMLFMLGLTNSIGGFEKLVPDARLNDGKFTLIIVEEAGLAEIGHIMTLATRGEHLKHPKVHFFKAEEVDISSFEEVHLNLDGEFGGVLPAHFINLKEHLEVRVPKSFYEEYILTDEEGQ